jgi:hypothetical protein
MKAHRGRLRVLRPPTAEERAAYFVSRGTSVPEEMRKAERPWPVRALGWAWERIWKR